jgi:2-polyprenyl-3-methyl-5-hydroxy-6-metoxy-1,4-benzoquinol methylase
MAHSRLHIMNDEQTQAQPPSSLVSNASRLARKKEMQAKFERLWLLHPEKFNPLRNCMQRERLERTWQLLNQHVALEEKKIVDIGCAAGVFSRRLRDAKASIIAVDIAENALKYLRQHPMHRIEACQEAMPCTSLPDEAFDIVVCTELIAELPREDYRLFFAELSRLVKQDGVMICSSPIDIYYSEDGAQKLLNLASTELEIIQSIYSYHALYLRLMDCCEAPDRFVKGWKSPDERFKELNTRQSFSYGWYYLNTTFVFMWLWIVLAPFLKRVSYKLKENRNLLLYLEKLCRVFLPERGISHLIFIARRRPLTIPIPSEPEIERPKRKQIWT